VSICCFQERKRNWGSVVSVDHSAAEAGGPGADAGLVVAAQRRSRISRTRLSCNAGEIFVLENAVNFFFGALPGVVSGFRDDICSKNVGVFLNSCLSCVWQKRLLLVNFVALARVVPVFRVVSLLRGDLVGGCHVPW
jgi:hypothetical protein